MKSQPVCRQRFSSLDQTESNSSVILSFADSCISSVVAYFEVQFFSLGAHISWKHLAKTAEFCSSQEELKNLFK